jgi:hypothetical protein
MPILEEFLYSRPDAPPVTIGADSLRRNATPTAELEPLTETYVQSDEADMVCS